MVNISIIIPTKDRTKLLKKTLVFLTKNKRFFSEIIIIDSSNEKNFNKNRYNIKNLKLNSKHFVSKPSTSLQRNIGLQKINKSSNYIMFLDDDVSFYKNALNNMRNFILKNKDYSGYGFNLMIRGTSWVEPLKTNKVFNNLNLYSNKPGKVSQSGWHSKAINLKKNTIVDWLPTQAVIFNRKDIKGKLFYLGFGSYSYLEDLEFSYSLRKKKKLVIVSKAKYKSENTINRNLFLFGKKELVNRYIFLKRNNLKKSKYFIMSFFILLKNFLKGLSNYKYFMRFFGNIYGLIKIRFI
jgi:glycosyltransferase involved in cell wall biosynthesis